MGIQKKAFSEAEKKGEGLIGIFYVGMYLLFAVIIISVAIKTGAEGKLGELLLNSFLLGGFIWAITNIEGKKEIEQYKRQKMAKWLDKEIGNA